MKVCNSIEEIKATPFFSQFSEEQIRRQVKTSAEGVRQMEARAKATGKKVGGFTLSELTAMAERYEKML